MFFILRVSNEFFKEIILSYGYSKIRAKSTVNVLDKEAKLRKIVKKIEYLLAA